MTQFPKIKNQGEWWLEKMQAWRKAHEKGSEKMNAKHLAKYTFACSYIGNVLGEATAVSENGAAWAMGKDYVVWLNIEKEGINVQIHDEWEMPDKLYQIFGYCQYQGIPCRII